MHDNLTLMFTVPLFAFVVDCDYTELISSIRTGEINGPEKIKAFTPGVMWSVMSKQDPL